MHTWFECKVKYVKIDEVSGREKKVNEPYLVDAVSFTEAENRIHQELEQMIRGDFMVTNIRKANYADIFPFDNADRWFKCKVSYVALDEGAGKEKGQQHHAGNGQRPEGGLRQFDAGAGWHDRRF